MSEITADTTTRAIDLNENASPVAVSSYSSNPALMKPKEGGATPTRMIINDSEMQKPSRGNG